MSNKELDERINKYITDLFYYIEYPNPYTIYPMWKYQNGKKKPIRELEIEEIREYRSLVENDIYNFTHTQEKDKLYEKSYEILLPLLEIKYKALNNSWTQIVKFHD